VPTRQQLGIARPVSALLGDGQLEVRSSRERRHLRSPQALSATAAISLTCSRPQTSMKCPPPNDCLALLLSFSRRRK